jgi:hypothetical protein
VTLTCHQEPLHSAACCSCHSLAEQLSWEGTACLKVTLCVSPQAGALRLIAACIHITYAGRDQRLTCGMVLRRLRESMRCTMGRATTPGRMRARVNTMRTPTSRIIVPANSFWADASPSSLPYHSDAGAIGGVSVVPCLKLDYEFWKCIALAWILGAWNVSICECKQCRMEQSELREL